MCVRVATASAPDQNDGTAGGAGEDAGGGGSPPPPPSGGGAVVFSPAVPRRGVGRRARGDVWRAVVVYKRSEIDGASERAFSRTKTHTHTHTIPVRTFRSSPATPVQFGRGGASLMALLRGSNHAIQTSPQAAWARR